MLIPLHPVNPQSHILDKVAADIEKGGIYIVPTDTVYAFATSLSSKKSIEKIYSLKKMPPNKPLSLYCRDFSHASNFIRMTDNRAFRWMKEHLPGPYTLVFQASKKLPQYTITKKKTVGIRIIDHPVIRGLLDRMESPIIGTSVYTEGEYFTYAEDLDQLYGKQIAATLDTGPVDQDFSTILDMSEYPPELLRAGKGTYEDFS